MNIDGNEITKEEFDASQKMILEELAEEEEECACIHMPSTCEPQSGAYGFSEFMDLRLERPRPVIEGLFNEGQNTIFAGPFGIGKTMLAIPMSMCLASGKDFQGRRVCRPYKTTFIDFENDMGEIQARLKTQQEALMFSDKELARLKTNWVYANTNAPKTALHRLTLKDLDQERRLDTFIDDHQPEIMIIDNLGRAFGELSDTEDVEAFYRTLDDLRERHSCFERAVIFFLHHLVKPSRGKGEQPASLLKDPYQYLGAVRGSGRLLDYAENRLAISKETVGGTSKYVINGVNRSAKVRPLVLDFNSKTLSFERQPDAALHFDSVFARAPRQKELFKLLPETFRFKETESLRDSAGRSFCKGTVAATLKVGVENGLLLHDEESGLYKSAPEEGVSTGSAIIQ